MRWPATKRLTNLAAVNPASARQRLPLLRVLLAAHGTQLLFSLSGLRPPDGAAGPPTRC
jgi:hypothetical protein